MHDPAYRIVLLLIVFALIDHFVFDGVVLNAIVHFVMIGINWIAGIFGG